MRCHYNKERDRARNNWRKKIKTGNELHNLWASMITTERDKHMKEFNKMKKNVVKKVNNAKSHKDEEGLNKKSKI